MNPCLKSMWIRYTPVSKATTVEALLTLVQPNVCILPNGHFVSRASDYIIYSVEAELIDKVVAEYGPCKTVPNLSVLHALPDICR